VTLHIFILNFKGGERTKSSSETDEQSSVQDYIGTCQFAQQMPLRAQKRKATDKQEQSLPVRFLLIIFIFSFMK
jgi:hypothetical protein